MTLLANTLTAMSVSWMLTWMPATTDADPCTRTRPLQVAMLEVPSQSGTVDYDTLSDIVMDDSRNTSRQASSPIHECWTGSRCLG